MSNLQTFLASIGVSVLVSTVVLLTILRPLRRVLSMMCKERRGAAVLAQLHDP